MAEFSRFVRPVKEPVLSEFCTRLTSIQQRDVDRAQTFPEVFSDFLAWLGPEEFSLCSWGAYDLSQFEVDCRRHSIPFPDSFSAHHLNLKRLFQERRGARKPGGMRQALSILGIPLEGQHHRGIDDARNIAKIARLLLEGA
jgi:inhibitor of KinA sporulation pathway (predicted exonuclease)